MSIILHTVDNGNVQAINDGRLYGEITGNVGGIVNGSVVTSAGGLALHVTSGWGIGYGRVFTITADDYTVQPASSGTQKGRLYVHIDISNPDNPIDIRSVAAASLPALVKENLSEGGAIYEIELAHYDVTALAVSNLVSNSKINITPVPKSGGAFNGPIYSGGPSTTGTTAVYARNNKGYIGVTARGDMTPALQLRAYSADGSQNNRIIQVDPDNNMAVTYAGGTFSGNIFAPNIPNFEHGLIVAKTSKTFTTNNSGTFLFAFSSAGNHGIWFARSGSSGVLVPVVVSGSDIEVTVNGDTITVTNNSESTSIRYLYIV